MRSQHVISAAGLDVHELAFDRHFADANQLDAIGLAVGRVVEEVLEVAHALGLDELIAHCLDVFLMLGRVGHIEDEASVRAVGVVPAAEQRCRLVEHGRLHSAEVEASRTSPVVCQSHLRGIPSKLLPANAGNQTPPQDLVLRFTRFTPDPSTIGSPCSREPTR